MPVRPHKWLICFWLIASFTAASPAMAKDVEIGRFQFTEWRGPALTIHYAEPKSIEADAPIIIVLHGASRNADTYRDNWIDLAKTYGFRVYAPEFKKKTFQGSAHYNLGSLGTKRTSAFTLIEPLFDFVKQRSNSTASYYYLFGHSAGAQFVHRATLLEDMPRLRLAIAANAGWYTLPDDAVQWPYGLANIPASSPNVSRWFRRPLLIMLGSRDTDTKSPALRRTPEAMAQGNHRVARGINFIRSAAQRAIREDATLNWRYIIVDGVDHNNKKMAEAAALEISNVHQRQQ